MLGLETIRHFNDRKNHFPKETKAFLLKIYGFGANEKNAKT